MLSNPSRRPTCRRHSLLKQAVQNQQPRSLQLSSHQAPAETHGGGGGPSPFFGGTVGHRHRHKTMAQHFLCKPIRIYTALDHSRGTLHLTPAEGTNCKGSLTALDTHAHAARDPRRRRKLCTNAAGDLTKALHCSSVRQNTIDADLLGHFTSSLRAFVSEAQTAAPCYLHVFCTLYSIRRLTLVWALSRDGHFGRAGVSWGSCYAACSARPSLQSGPRADT